MAMTQNAIYWLARGCAVAFMFGVLALPTLAQTNKGTIKGTITDQGGGIVQKATVKVTNVDTNAERSVNTGDDGTYEVPLLEPGKYKVTVTAPTFPETVRENIVVQTSSTEVVDITLTAGVEGAGGTVTGATCLCLGGASEHGWRNVHR